MPRADKPEYEMELRLEQILFGATDLLRLVRDMQDHEKPHQKWEIIDQIKQLKIELFLLDAAAKKKFERKRI